MSNKASPQIFWQNFFFRKTKINFWETNFLGPCSLLAIINRRYVVMHRRMKWKKEDAKQRPSRHSSISGDGDVLSPEELKPLAIDEDNSSKYATTKRKSAGERKSKKSDDDNVDDDDGDDDDEEEEKEDSDTFDKDERQTSLMKPEIFQKRNATLSEKKTKGQKRESVDNDDDSTFEKVRRTGNESERNDNKSKLKVKMTDHQ